MTDAPILIAGPTASGKSALALAIAERVNGVVINADSTQVYRELAILTARPSQVDEARVPHALYGHVAAMDAYSAGRFIIDAKAAIDAASAHGHRPIIVGGTGLYFKALLEGLSPIPAIPDDIRSHWRAEAERIGAPALHDLLSQRDPVMAARLKPNDTQRIVRALEVLEASGRSLADWQAQPGTPVIDPATAVKLAVLPDRAALYARAEARFDRMLAMGALAEAEALARLQLDPTLPALRALGVAQLMDVVQGKLDLTEAISVAKAETRQYIKRQATWINTNMITWKSVTTQQIERLDDDFMPFIQS